MALTEAGDRSDTVILRVPRERGSLPVMRVVIGGVASRHALSVDRLDDVELAVETLFREEPAEGGDLTLTVGVVEDTFRVLLAGLRSQLVKRTLSAAGGLEPGIDGRAEVLRMIMDSLVDDYQTADGAVAGSFSVQLEKRIP